MESEWYFFKRVRKLKEYYSAPWWSLFSGIEIYREGIMQINEKGETRVIWEKE